MRFANSAAPNLLVFEVPDLNSVTGEKVLTYALPLIARQGGLLVALPVGVIDEDAFPHSPADEDQMVGPMKVLENIELYEEDETGTGAIQAVACGISCSVVICNFLDTVLQHMREYDPVADSLLEAVPYDETRPAALLLHSDLLPLALEWARSEVEGRVLFYSAREEPEQDVPPVAAPNKAAPKRVTNSFNVVLAERVSSLAAQMQVLMKQQASQSPGQLPAAPGPQLSFADLANGPLVGNYGSRISPVSAGLAAKGGGQSLPGGSPAQSQTPVSSIPFQVREEGYLGECKLLLRLWHQT